MYAEIAEYKVATYSRDPAHHHLAAIGLKDTTGSYVGVIHFFREGYDLPPAGTSSGVAMHFHISEMPLILDILRNESPIFLNTSGSTAHLGTTTEPIGEGET